MTQSASDAHVLLSQIQAAYQAILADNLIGLYVHGSLAMDCFIWDHSDIDFLVVVKAEPSLTQKEALIRTLLRLNPSAPKKGWILIWQPILPFCAIPAKYFAARRSRKSSHQFHQRLLGPVPPARMPSASCARSAKCLYWQRCPRFLRERFAAFC